MSQFSSTPIREKDQKCLTFIWDRQQFTCTVLPQGCVNFFALGQNVVQRNLDRLDSPQNSSLAHYTGGIMLIRPGEQKGRVTTQQHIHSKQWEKDYMEIQSSPTYGFPPT